MEDGYDRVRVEGPQPYIDIYIGRECFPRLLYKVMVDHEDLVVVMARMASCGRGRLKRRSFEICWIRMWMEDLRCNVR